MKTPERFEQSSEGYLEAKEWLLNIGEWERVSTSGFSTDGYSIVAAANDIYNSGNWSNENYKTFLEKCCELLDWDKEEVHNMKNTNFWLWGIPRRFRDSRTSNQSF